MRIIHLARAARRWLSADAGDDRGSIPVEYLAVFAFVSIGLALSVVKLGPTLLQSWGTTQHVLLANKP
jgi:hypothetical protein